MVKLAVIVALPASSPDGWDEMSAVTGRVFVAQNPEQFTYDADGNMTCDGRFRYTWNAENRLVRAQELCAPTNRNPYTVTYAYDHKGRMVSKRITENDGQDTLVKSVSYLWDGWNIIREVQGSGVRDQGSDSVLVTDNVWGLDLDGTMQGAGGGGGLLAVIRSNSNSNSNSSTPNSSTPNSSTPNSSTPNSSTPNSSTHQLFFTTYDANGNISEYVSEGGELVAHYDYSPFGELLVESGEMASTFTHRFSTKPWCPITGLYEYQMRKYRPEIGRWVSRDPIGEVEFIPTSLDSFSSSWLGWNSPVVGAVLTGMIYSPDPVDGASVFDRHITTMLQDAKWLEYMYGDRLGTSDGYSVARHNCRRYSQWEFRDAPRHW